MDYAPRNSATQGTNKVRNQIQLNGEWKVGMTEISFSFDIEKVLEGKFYFLPLRFYRHTKYIAPSC